jgi:hypothetical protein
VYVKFELGIRNIGIDLVVYDGEVAIAGKYVEDVR